MRWAALLLAATVASACGGEVPQTLVRFQIAGPGCLNGVPGLQAKIQMTGGDECPLEVLADRTVQGLCPQVPSGSVITFRLVYFVLLANDPTPVDLVTGLLEADLRGYEKESLELDFANADLRSDIDDDLDGVFNLQELCDGSNPRG